MAIYAISDLHLSKVKPKPMDIFGQGWSNHWDKIKNDWTLKVCDDDIILIPGDISWALTLSEALPDILDISDMPGKKIFVRGNHDYWWESPTKMKKLLPQNIQIIQNDCIELKEFCICGTRGWMLLGDERFKENDLKIYKRELIRLELSLSQAQAASQDKPIIVMLHYPPFNEKNNSSEFIDIMKRYNVRICIYGHLHGESLKNVIEGEYSGIQFHMVSCDYLNFKLKRLV